jgi:UDP-N-acetylmuramate: L-alanyl-gamma-D-glutamyl-meso-diaminopimelate ligase
MRIHILGICGTFMGSIALLAKQLGHEVVGSDENVYPPMSTQLQAQGIQLIEGFDPIQLNPTPDIVIIGNAMKRGNPCIEYILNYNLPYISGPQWLAENVLKDRWVLAVTGTHGKTTTSSILTWILEYAGLKSGFLIGGIPNNFGVSARLGEGPFFVIEGDEYDTAFFDKRSKFVHYHPRTLILNNLEFDHADIFPNLAAIQTQFHHLIRTVPHNGLIVNFNHDNNLQEVLSRGCWTPVETFGEQASLWHAENINIDGTQFDVVHRHDVLGTVHWPLLGKHNVDNAIAAIAAAHHAGVPIEKAVAALSSFMNVKRRLEMRGQVNGVTVYDDFAHHPTAIAATIAALRARVRNQRIIAVVEFGSYTMSHGCHQVEDFVTALKGADYVLMLRPSKADWNIDEVASELQQPARVHDTVDQIVQDIVAQASFGDQVLIMSNKGFAGIHNKLLKTLQNAKLIPTRNPFFVS